MVGSHVHPTGDLAHNPGMCPDWESNQRPFGSQATLNPLSRTSQGTFFILNNLIFVTPKFISFKTVDSYEFVYL